MIPLEVPDFTWAVCEAGTVECKVFNVRVQSSTGDRRRVGWHGDGVQSAT